MQKQNGCVFTTYGATPFDQFLDWEEIPVIRNFVVKRQRVREVAVCIHSAAANALTVVKGG